jgi:HPt (histidine-containing phosphotransfer) domain-containing protein
MNIKTINVPILLNNFSGDEEILLDMINAFEQALPNLINSIRESIVNQDRDQLRINAHTFKGIMKSFYVNLGSEMAYELEERGINDNFKGAFVTLNNLENQLMIFLYELQILKKELYQIS